jgi:hypothetical protein
MRTVEQIRRQQWAGYWRLREQQETIVREFMVPVAKLWGEKMREVYPDLIQQGTK